MTGHDDIRIGTIVKADHHPVETIRQILAHGFECFELVFSRHIGDIDLEALAEGVQEVFATTNSHATISSLGLYGNTLTDPQTERDFARLIDAASKFGCRVVCGFTGRITDRSVPESLPRLKEVFTPLVKKAEDRGVKIAFENCDCHGNWESGDLNIAHAPRAWEMIFDALPSDVVGLEWEPCHQLFSLIDPIPQLRKWLGKIFHIHGKDATVCWDIIREQGMRGGQQCVFHRTPGFGDTNWTDVISMLRMGGYRGAIDIEGWHDPVYRDALEMTGQVHALEYLKRCRGGAFVPNPL